MPWETPSLFEVRRLVRDYIASYLPGADANVPNNPMRVLSDANAGVGFQTFLYLDWLALQLLPDTAETEWLDRHGQIWLGGRKAASFAAGVVNVTGIEGTVLPSATRLSGRNNVTYETTQAITVSALPTPVATRALTAGAIGNLDPASTIGVTDAVSGIDGIATVVTMNGGTDQENDDSLRDRVLFRIRRPPMGGDKDDYVAWSRSVTDVTRAWSAPNEMGIGTVTVRFMMDNLRANADPLVDGFPLSQDIAAVKAYLDTVRPVAIKDFWVVAPIPFAINFTISGLDVDTLAVRAAIKSSVKAMLKERAVPGQKIFRSWVDEAISAAVGEDHHELTFSSTDMPSAGHLAVIGTVSYA